MARKLQIIGEFPSGGEVDMAEVQAMVDDYLEENPPTTRFTINGQEADENGNFTINIQAEESNNNVVEF